MPWFSWWISFSSSIFKLLPFSPSLFFFSKLDLHVVFCVSFPLCLCPDLSDFVQSFFCLVCWFSFHLSSVLAVYTKVHVNNLLQLLSAAFCDSYWFHELFLETQSAAKSNQVTSKAFDIWSLFTNIFDFKMRHWDISIKISTLNNKCVLPDCAITVMLMSHF